MGNKTSSLTTAELYYLDEACSLIRRAFKELPCLVGTAGSGGPYRDVDVRLMLDEEEYAKVCPTQERWELMSLAISAYLTQRTGLKIDFQIQRTKEANTMYGDKPRNPLGVGRTFAGGGDATPAHIQQQEAASDA